MPFHLTPKIWIDVVPEFLREDKRLEEVSEYDRQLFDLCTHCLIIEYEADALNSPDLNWQGKETRPVEYANLELAYLANIAFWLQHPSPISFTSVFHMREMPEYGKFIIQASQRCNGFLCHPNDVNQRIRDQDLESARNLFTSLANVPRETSVWTALRSTAAAFQSDGEEIRYLLLWVAIEALFGTSMEIKFRISQRLAFFVGKDKSEARAIYDQAKKAYDFRSRVAHGTWKSDKTSTALTATTEMLLRRALICLVSDGAIAGLFFGGNDKRDSYLDELVFSL